ncbi:MAG: HAMP domain-containing histidine kinase [Erysipelothrix sp.]|nr:HAMP domain-containing histidine kinase [Erysipelothrix sp.]
MNNEKNIEEQKDLETQVELEETIEETETLIHDPVEIEEEVEEIKIEKVKKPKKVKKNKTEKKNILAKKVGGFTLFIVSLLFVIASVISIIGFFATESYVETKERVQEKVLENVLNKESYFLMDDINYTYGNMNIVGLNEEVLTNILNNNYQNTNLIIKIHVDDELIYSKNAEAASRDISIKRELYDYYGDEYVGKLEVGLKEKFDVVDKYVAYEKITSMLYELKYWIYLILIVSLVGTFTGLVILLTREGKDELRFIDSVPLEIVLTAIYILTILFLETFPLYYNDLGSIFSFGLILAAISSVFSTLSRRSKHGVLYTNTILYSIYKVFHNMTENLNILIKVVIVLLTSFTIDIFLYTILYYDTGVYIVVLGVKYLIMLAVGVKFFNDLEDIRTGIEVMARGNVDFKFQVESYQSLLKPMTLNLNEISNGTANAVERQMASERMKTELITNVSHDIKTPITSIINYVNLIGETDDLSKIKEYTEVLDRQSDRLKNLVEDLIEASKLTTGNVTIEKEATNLNVLMAQIVGEYSDKMDKKGLELVYPADDVEKMIMVDGKLLSRALDNVLNNAVNYSLENTRIYVDTKELSNQYVVEVKNISKASLVMEATELMERFTRGDSSRNTEGSGLGLSIAKSIVELNNGTFEINIDGDLFKVVLTLPKTSSDIDG